ncbi:MAG: HAD family hydrolase [Oscillospiraceae bacterium]|jgi:FMN phosphatase YigB (HAD superfamily)|nr:HAD family hydrolase [Oscillospiraceae bacterium]
MIRAICFDLDGTLLPVHSAFYDEHYIPCLARAIPGQDPRRVAQAVLDTMRGIMRENQPGVTVERRFAQGLAERLGMPFDQQETHYMRYYIEQFPRLAEKVTPRPQVAAAVRAARAKGIRTVLATNPVIPGVATLERLRWAGVQPEDFEFITLYESCCYTKPHVAYFIHEVLAPLALPPQDVLMVGNDPKEDIAPAHTLGMETFFLNVYPEHLDSVPPCWDAQGDYDDMLAMVERLPGIS